MQNVQIRVAKEKDLPTILKLYAQPDLDGKALPPAKAKPILAKFSKYPDYKLYVAEHKKKIVGTFALLIMPTLGHCGSPAGLVEDVVVSTKHQGQKIGTAMMKFAMNQCRKKDCYKLLLSSNFKRKRAHQFYQNLGFKKYGFGFKINFK